MFTIAAYLPRPTNLDLLFMLLGTFGVLVAVGGIAKGLVQTAVEGFDRAEPEATGGILQAAVREADTAEPDSNRHPPTMSRLAHSHVVLERAAFDLLWQLRHGGHVSVYLLFSPDGRSLAIWRSEEIQMWDVASGRSAGKLEGNRNLVGFSRDSATVLVAESDGMACLSRDGLERLPSPFPPHEVALSLARTHAFMTSGGGVLTRIDPDKSWEPHQSAVSPDGLTAVACQFKHVVMWTIADGHVLWKSEDNHRDISAVAWSPDGRQVVYGTMGGSVFVVDAASHETIKRFTVGGEVRCIAVSPDGSIAVGCGDLQSDIVFCSYGYDRIQVLPTESNSNIWSIAFSPDGTLLASAHDDGLARLWRASPERPPRWPIYTRSMPSSSPSSPSPRT